LTYAIRIPYDGLLVGFNLLKKVVKPLSFFRYQDSSASDIGLDSDDERSLYRASSVSDVGLDTDDECLSDCSGDEKNFIRNEANQDLSSDSDDSEGQPSSSFESSEMHRDIDLD